MQSGPLHKGQPGVGVIDGAIEGELDGSFVCRIYP